jgi:ABC-type transport system involved in cytochrome bd biosynthesis fused ATPase/permease subunit
MADQEGASMIDFVTAAFSLGDALLTVLEIFLFVAWFWILIAIISDLFSDHTVSGWGKAAWTVGLLLLPFLGAFIYLIARGGTMHERAARRQAEATRHFETYVRQTAGASPADELVKLTDLRDRGTISEAEFEQMKTKVLAGGG